MQEAIKDTLSWWDGVCARQIATKQLNHRKWFELKLNIKTRRRRNRKIQRLSSLTVVVVVVVSGIYFLAYIVVWLQRVNFHFSFTLFMFLLLFIFIVRASLIKLAWAGHVQCSYNDYKFTILRAFNIGIKTRLEIRASFNQYSVTAEQQASAFLVWQ